jgi:hypothetical protein
MKCDSRVHSWHAPLPTLALAASPRLGLRQVWSNQHVKLITLVGFNLVKQVNKPIEPVFEPLISSTIPIKSVFVRLVKIVIPPNTFQQHLPKTFFQLEVGEMEIDKTLFESEIKTFALRDGLSLKKKQLTKINLGSKENLQHVKISGDLEPIDSHQLIELLMEFNDIFA